MNARLARGICVPLFALITGGVVSAQPAPQEKAKAAQDYSQEAVVVEQARAAMRFEKDGTARRDIYMRLRAQSEAGVQQWGQLLFGYNAANEKPEIEFVRVKKPDGTVITTSADAVQDLSSPVQRIAPVYTDFRQKHVTVQSLRPGDTLEFSVVTTTHTPLAPGQFWTEYDFQKNLIVLDEQLDIDVPADSPIRLKTRPGFDASTKDAAGRRVYHWSGSHLTRADDEAKNSKRSPSDEPEPPAVRLTTFQNWEQVGKWYAALESTPRVPTDAIRQKAQELIAGRSTDLEKLEALYSFVATNFRYVSLSLGAGRYQPRPAADVLREQYGDCKDKHTLLASLIDAAGMRASAVLINSSRKIDPDFPSPSQFDHVITRAMAGNDPIWLDTTAEVAPFRLLGFTLRKKKALVVDPAAPRLEETPANPPFENSLIQDVDGKISEAGKLTAHVKATARGDVELLLRTIFRATPASQWKKVFERIVTEEDANGELGDWKVSDPAATKDPFTMEFTMSSAGFVDWTKKKIDLTLPFSNINVPAVDQSAEAETRPVELGPAGAVAYQLRLELPERSRPRAPVPVTMTRDYADYRASYSVTNNVFVAERAMRIRETELPAARRQDYAAFSRVVGSDAGQTLAIDPGTIAASDTAPADLKVRELNQNGYDALQAGNYSQAIALLTRVVELEPKDKYAWNNLGRAYLALRHPTEAIAAFRKQIEINPYDEYAHNNLGRAYLMERKYDAAEAAFQKQLEVNPLDKYAHGNLGDMYLEQKKYDRAAAEFEKAAALRPDDAPLQVQIGKAYLGLKQTSTATEAFDRAVALAPNPYTWNNIAYELSLNAVDLDRAQQYAESAVAAITAASRNLDVEHADRQALAVVSSLGAYWDTLGWVHFAKGNLKTAERFVDASWRLAQHAEVGDHLAQIYEKQGRREDAIRLYALALAAERPSDDVRTRLAKLAGSDRVEALVDDHRAELSAMRTTPLAITGAAGTHADFFILFSAPSAVEGVKFAEGDENLRSAGDVVRKMRFTPPMFPDETPAKILRRAMVVCPPADGSCGLTLLLPDDARPMK